MSTIQIPRGSDRTLPARGYLVTLSYAPSWRKKFGSGVGEIREAAKEAFGTTARKLNRKAKEIGTEADYQKNLESRQWLTPTQPQKPSGKAAQTRKYITYDLRQQTRGGGSAT